MSDKALIIGALQKLPEGATISDIRREVEFIAAVKAAREQVRRGDVVTLDEVEKKLREYTIK